MSTTSVPDLSNKLEKIAHDLRDGDVDTAIEQTEEWLKLARASVPKVERDAAIAEIEHELQMYVDGSHDESIEQLFELVGFSVTRQSITDEMIVVVTEAMLPMLDDGRLRLLVGFVRETREMGRAA